MITFDKTKCVACNNCVRVCPSIGANSVEHDENGKVVFNINTDKCIRCGACVKVCFSVKKLPIKLAVLNELEKYLRANSQRRICAFVKEVAI